MDFGSRFALRRFLGLYYYSGKNLDVIRIGAGDTGVVEEKKEIRV